MKYLTREYALALTVFSKEPFGITLGGGEVDAYQLVVAASGFVLFFDPKRLFGLIAVIALVFGFSSFLMYSTGDALSQLFLRQAAAVFFIYVGLGAILMNCSRERLIAAYVQVCFIAAILGLLQLGLSFAGINILIKVPLRLDSLAGEPSHYAVAIAPCVYYCLTHLTTLWDKQVAAVIVLSLLLTVSATAVAVLALAISVAFYSRRGILTVLALLLFGPLLLTIPPEVFPEVIASRITSMQRWANTSGESWESNNLTVLSFSTNLDVALSTISDGRLFGNGFCGHASAYHRRFEGTEFVNHRRYGINAPAAHCLTIRIVSEFGILGILFLAVVVWKAVRMNGTIWHMFLLFALAGRSLKLGSWIDYGFPMFLMAAWYLANRPVGKAAPQSLVQPRTGTMAASKGVI